MKKTEELFENYEDAMMALLMDEILTAQGVEALKENEQIQKDPHAVFSSALDKRCMKLIRQHRRKQNVRKYMGKLGKASVRFAATACIVLMCITAALAAFPKLRTATVTFLTEHFDESLDFRQDEVDVNLKDQHFMLKLSYIPKHYVLDSQDVNSQRVTYTYLSDIDGGKLEIMFYNIPNLVSLDRENAQVEDIDINRNKAKICYADSETKLTWVDQESNITVLLYASDVDKKDVLRIAEGLRISNS